MKDKDVIIKLLKLISVIILYYISGNNNLFLYVLTLSLYNIYVSSFSHITLKETYKKIKYNYSKLKILKYLEINMSVICLLFIILSIFISDAMNIFLNIENTFFPYLIMSLSIITEPLIKVLSEYLESYSKTKLSSNLLNIYNLLEMFILLIIGIITLRLIKLPTYISISLLYLSKIFSFLIVISIIYKKIKKLNLNLKKTSEEKQVNYKEELKVILTNNSQKSIITLIKNSYYYISLIILYAVLSTRYSYQIDTIEKDLTFIYLYGIYMMNFLVYFVESFNKNISKKENVINYIYIIFKKILTIAIVLGITSPLISKIVFNDNSNSIYLTMLNFLSIFIILYDITFENTKSKKIIYISLIMGIICKLILVIPLIDSFYRIGYNLIYGDIISTIISMSISIAINYIYIKINNQDSRTFEKILKTLYESILLCIILILTQFIVPIRTDSYVRALFTFILYIFISIMFVKLKKKRRG